MWYCLYFGSGKYRRGSISSRCTGIAKKFYQLRFGKFRMILKDSGIHFLYIILYIIRLKAIQIIHDRAMYCVAIHIFALGFDHPADVVLCLLISRIKRVGINLQNGFFRRKFCSFTVYFRSSFTWYIVASP